MSKKKQSKKKSKRKKQVEKKYNFSPELLDLFDDLFNRASGGKMPKRKK